MTAQDRPYIRVYYEIVSDPKFETIYGDDANLAGWLRLLIGADAAWPEPAPLPRWLSEPVLDALIDAELVTRTEHDHYRVIGLDTERTTARERARRGGLARGKQLADSNRSATAKRPHSERSATAQPLLSAPLRSAPLQNRAGARGNGLEAVKEVLEANGIATGGGGAH